MVSGRSTVSESDTSPPTTVNRQVVAAGRSAAGSTVIRSVPVPPTVKFWGVPTGHSSSNESVSTFTGSLKSTTMFAPLAMSVAPSAGVVDWTNGASSTVVNVQVTSPAISSGGSVVSASVTSVDSTVTVQT